MLAHIFRQLAIQDSAEMMNIAHYRANGEYLIHYPRVTVALLLDTLNSSTRWKRVRFRKDGDIVISIKDPNDLESDGRVGIMDGDKILSISNHKFPKFHEYKKDVWYKLHRGYKHFSFHDSI